VTQIGNLRISRENLNDPIVKKFLEANQHTKIKNLKDFEDIVEQMNS